MLETVRFLRARVWVIGRQRGCADYALTVEG